MKKIICFVVVIILLCVGVGILQFRINTLNKIIKERETKIMALTELTGITAGTKIATAESLTTQQDSFLDKMIFYQSESSKLIEKINAEVEINKQLVEKIKEASSLKMTDYYLIENRKAVLSIDTLKSQLFELQKKEGRACGEYINFLENELVKLLGPQPIFQPCKGAITQ